MVRRQVPLLAPTFLALVSAACQRTAAPPAVASADGPAVTNGPSTVLSTPTATTTPAAAARLTVHVADLRNHAGNLVFGVFRSADGFPSDKTRAVAWHVGPADGDGTFTVDLPPGTYAASVLHDENENGQIDKNFFGIPTEGYGVTNNPKPRRRAARFDEATFPLQPGGTSVTISIQYSFT